MRISKLKFLLVLGVIALIASFFYFDLIQYFSIGFIKSQEQQFFDVYNKYPVLTIFVFYSIYVVSTMLSLPVATIFTLSSGYLFGLPIGLVIASFASVTGASVAFLMSRFLFRDWIQDKITSQSNQGQSQYKQWFQKKFADKLKIINQGIRKDGNFYLFSIRLIPGLPFFVVNLVMGLTPIKLVNFVLVSQIGMLPATIVYVNAGTQLSKIESLKQIISPQIMLSFLILAAFPWVAKAIINFLSKKPTQANA